MTTRLSRDAYGLRLAEAAALRADCTRRQVGAVIVAEDGSIVSTGYNGLASGRPGCASAGACPRGQMAYPSEPPYKVGETDPTPDNLTGRESCQEYHVSPTGYYFECHWARDHEGWHVSGDGSRVNAVWPIEPTHPASVGYETTGCRAVHAEINAIIRAGRDRCVGATIYVTDEPCFHCSVVIEGAGITRVVTPGEHVPAYLQELRDAEDPSWGATSDDWDRIESEAAAELLGGISTADLEETVPALTETIRTAFCMPASGPLDPEIHAALVRSVERGRSVDHEGRPWTDERARREAGL